MRNNRTFAFVFRICALLFALTGVLAQTGIFGGRLSGASFMYYTIQSNLLAIALFAMLSIRTFWSLGESRRGYTGWHTPFSLVCTVDILVTFAVFWTLLSSQVSAEYLWTFENIAVHTVTPLLCLADFIMFADRKIIKYKHIYLTCIFPLFYAVFSAIAGIAGYVYGHTGFVSGASPVIEWVPVRAPYFFLDYWNIGAWAAVYIAGIMIFILAIGHGLYFICKEREQKDK